MTNQRGSVLFLAVMMLTLLSILGFSAMHTSTVERRISTNELLYQQYFYAAEAGIAHAVQTLREPFQAANADRVAAGMRAIWDFALAGAAGQADAAGPAHSATEENGDEVIPGTAGSGICWIENQPLSGLRFSVTLWNNAETAVGDSDDGGNVQSDHDGRIWLRSEATGPRGGGVGIQVLLESAPRRTAVLHYPAPAGAGRNFNDREIDPIVGFQPQR